MSTLQRNLIQTGPVMKTNCFDKIPDYHGRSSVALGFVILLFGLLSIALGIGSICTIASGFFIGYGIWCGFIFCLTGIITMVAGCTRSACMILTTLVFCITAICCGAIQFSIGIVATNTDAVSSRNDQMDFGPIKENYYAYDIFYSKNNFQHMCAGSDVYTWVSSWGPVDVLLLLVGFIEFAVAIAAAALTCHSTCNGHRDIKDMATHTGFQNDAYMTNERMSPPLYKVGM